MTAERFHRILNAASLSGGSGKEYSADEAEAVQHALRSVLGAALSVAPSNSPRTPPRDRVNSERPQPSQLRLL